MNNYIFLLIFTNTFNPYTKKYNKHEYMNQFITIELR